MIIRKQTIDDLEHANIYCESRNFIFEKANHNSFPKATRKPVPYLGLVCWIILYIEHSLSFGFLDDWMNLQHH